MRLYVLGTIAIELLIMRLKKIVTLMALAGALCVSNTALANTSNSANDKAKMNLFFGTSAIGKSSDYTPPLPRLTLMSGKVVAPNSCNGDVSFAVTNAFTDGTLKRIYENFDEILSSLMSKGGLIYMASLYISQSNPHFYQLITEGIGVSITDFLSQMGSCEAIANSLVDNVMTNEDINPVYEIQKNSRLNKIIETNAESQLGLWKDVKVEDVYKKGADEAAQRGFTIFGRQKAGDGQDALDVVNDVLQVGWCVYRGFTKEECEKYRESKPDELIDSDHLASKVIKDANGINEAGMRLVGNSYISVCSGCDTITTPPQDAVEYLTDLQSIFAARISNVAVKNINTVTSEEYQSVSSGYSIVADANYLRNLAVLENDPEVRRQFIDGWAYDLAYYEILQVISLVRQSIKGAESTSDIQTAGLSAQMQTMLKQLDRRVVEIENYNASTNYKPRMYVVALLSVGDRVSKGLAPLGDIRDYR